MPSLLAGSGTDAGGNGTTQNPYTCKAGIQDRITGWVKFGAR